MRFEFSAGGVVFKRGTTPLRQGSEGQAQNNANIFILVAQHSQHHGWVFPKGLIGDTVQDEKKETTAIREVEEETGIIAEIIRPLTPTTFWYQFKGEKIKKTVYYFLMKHAGGDTKNHDHEMEQVEWIPVDEVEKRLTYKSDKTVWQEAQKVLLSNLR